MTRPDEQAQTLEKSEDSQQTDRTKCARCSDYMYCCHFCVCTGSDKYSHVCDAHCHQRYVVPAREFTKKCPSVQSHPQQQLDEKDGVEGNINNTERDV
mmetsp:Transcript_38836/g.91218  ORF Transcript_38836/g.91218 Transcript_38836/m.91218 type:complete len:98 (+) Transcript_38836:1085-1378(+)